MTDKVLGLDLNDYRKDVPLKVAKQQGVRFVINKATQGTTILHVTNEIYRRECKALGLPYGNYMYWRFVVDAVAQVEYYLEHIGEVQFPPIVDVERLFNTRPGTKTQPVVSVLANRNHLGTVLSELEKRTGIKPMIYTNYATWFYLFDNWRAILNYPLWVANWRAFGDPYMPKPAVNYDLHQYTNNYKVAGYYKGVDANWFNGNEAAFEQYVAKYEALWRPGTPPPSEKKTVVTLETLKSGDSHISLLEPGDFVKVEVSEI